MRKGRALVIDDSAPVRRAVVSALEEGGDFEAIGQAGDGMSGLRMMAEFRPDIVVCDLVMPGLDGLQLLRLRATRTELVAVPVIILTSEAVVERKVELFERGASDYVTKPFDPRELLARVRVHLRLKLVNEDMETANAQLRHLSCTDPLMTVFNRRHFDSVLAAEVSRMNRYAVPMSLLLLDLDHFKRVNDEHGHDAGDRVLTEVAAALVSKVRTADIVARYGGEEIAVVLSNTPAEGAHILAERLRQAVEDLRIHHAGRDLSVTVSVGIASGLIKKDSPAELLKRADLALYAAKRSGRNRAVVYDDSFEEAPLEFAAVGT